MKKLLIIFGLLVVLGLRSDAVLTNLIVTGEETISGVITGIYYEVFGSDSGVRVWTNVTGAYIGTNGTYTPDTYVLTRGGLSGYWYHKTSDVLNVLGDYYNSDFGKIVKVAIFLDHYVDNGDGTVSDKTTGLMWAKDANILGYVTNWYAGTNWAAELDHAGYQDWRLPSAVEFSRDGTHGATNGLVDAYGTTNIPALPQGHPFANVQEEALASRYWSTTPYSAGALRVRLNDGLVNEAAKSSEYYLWPCRGP